MKKIILLIIFIPFYSPISAQNNSDFSMNFNHVALSVKDLDESAKFYMNTLNLKEITNKTKKASRRWLSLGEGKELHLISDYNGNVIVNKAVHMALTTSNFDSFIKKLQAMQIKYYDWPGNQNIISIRADGIRQVFFQDPNGYWIEVNSVGEN
ncbi:VOC family protein [Thalassobellus suaedae]|uniref:VOC family protein n=1 Tax=Thalassobellus suaedae TaxID=3074124 RepID=A0ABY9Y6B3_9FLAO|nr:VOC family protein [Flavobacteriaceae bacterium HL-DH10]